MILGATFSFNKAVFADDRDNIDDNISIETTNCGDVDSNFLSFPTWSRGLNCEDLGGGKIGSIVIENDSPADIIFIVALNIVDIALRAVGIIAIGFIIYGGFRYVISRGSPEETKKAMDTILKAVIGMVIAMISAIAVSFLVSRLGK